MQYVGKTRQALSARVAQHQLDPLKRGLDFRTLHTGLSELEASGSEQAYIEKLNLIENGLNKINGMSAANPRYQEAKDAATAAGAVPAMSTSMSGIEGAASVLFRFYYFDFNAASKYTTKQGVL